MMVIAKLLFIDQGKGNREKGKGSAAVAVSLETIGIDGAAATIPFPLSLFPHKQQLVEVD